MNGLILFAANVVLSIANRQAVYKYVRRNGRWPNIAHPDHYSERMLWRKVVDHNPMFIVFSDKLAAKDYCKRLCPELALPKTLWVGDNADEIPAECLSGDVFVKTNHGWRCNYEISDGKINRAKLKEATDQWLHRIHGEKEDQWAYSKVEPKLFVEESVGDAKGDLLEMNVRASDGAVVMASVVGRNNLPNKWTVYLDADGTPTAGPIDQEGGRIAQLPAGVEIMEPYQQALRYAERLSVGVDYARFDFMWNGRVLFGGEITVYPAAGNGEIFNKVTRDKVLGGWDLRVSHFLSSEQTGARKWYANALRSQLR